MKGIESTPATLEQAEALRPQPDSAYALKGERGASLLKVGVAAGALGIGATFGLAIAGNGFELNGFPNPFSDGGESDPA